MSKYCWVVMKERYSPIYRTSAHPHAVFKTKKEAIEEATKKQKVANKNNYWVEKAEDCYLHTRSEC